jgi:hypothetical protein
MTVPPNEAIGSAEALKLAACVLEVLAGLRRPSEAADALRVSLARYYQLEQRALQGLVRGCEPAKRGRAGSSSHEEGRLRQEVERLRRECQRQQALVRMARQAAGLNAPEEATAGGGKKRRRPARGQRAADRLRQAAITGESTGPSSPVEA